LCDFVTSRFVRILPTVAMVVVLVGCGIHPTPTPVPTPTVVPTQTPTMDIYCPKAVVSAYTSLYKAIEAGFLSGWDWWFYVFNKIGERRTGDMEAAANALREVSVVPCVAPFHSKMVRAWDLLIQYCKTGTSE
jgi:hypothetical protein